MLPDRYNRLGVDRPLRFVSYIASTGTQWIDTGVAPDFAEGDSVEIDFDLPAYSNPTPDIFGSRGAGIKNGFYLTGAGYVSCDNYGYTVTQTVTVGRHLFSASDAGIINNDAAYPMPRRVTCAQTMYLFAINNDGSPSASNPNLKIYRWRYWRSGTLAKDLVPALSGGVPGLWDTVSRTFLHNAGTGTFNYA
ncbi:MAG: hypothetical protein IJS01_10215 [Lentisphaeria bacterium]|nr:hypothetical protein [Lentisphaeria bacterium]